MIYPKDKVRDSVERAFLLDPQAGLDAAQALGLDAETVRECWEAEEPAHG
jgi:hypothetical protein